MTNRHGWLAILIAVLVAMPATASAHVIRKHDVFDPRTALDIQYFGAGDHEGSIVGFITTRDSFSNHLLSQNGTDFYMNFDTGRTNYFAWIYYWRGVWKAKIRRFVGNTDRSITVGRGYAARIDPDSVGFAFDQSLIDNDLSFRFQASSVWRGCECWDRTHWIPHRP